jgi:protein TonB
MPKSQVLRIDPMKQHCLLTFAIACLVFAPIALCQDDSTKTAPDPVPGVRVKMEGPHATYAPDPEFPEKERKARQRGKGTVVLSLVVNSDGLPSDIKVLRTLSPDFDKAAMDAVKKWRFSPGTRDGKPVAVQIKVEVTFHLGR